MTVMIVVAFEVIGIDQNQRQQAALASGALEFDFQKLIETSAIGQPGQLVFRGDQLQVLVQLDQGCLGIEQLVFCAYATVNMPDQTNAESDHQPEQHQHDQNGLLGLAQPVEHGFFLAQCDNGHDRVDITAFERIKTRNAVNSGNELSRA